MGPIMKNVRQRYRMIENKLFTEIKKFKNGSFFQCFFAIVTLSMLIRNTSGALHTLETPVRESLLKPRNFNPHPYGSSDYLFLAQHQERQQQESVIDLDINSINEASSDYVDNNIYGIDTIPRFPARHPSNGIFSQAPHQFPQTLPPGQQSLRNDVEINRAKSPPSIDDPFNNIQKKQYAFSYTVRDIHSGDDFSHTQQQKNGAVKGTYKVQLPDGRTQVVRYTADNGGYRAEVSYLKNKYSVREQINHHPLKNGHDAAYVIGPAEYPLNNVHNSESTPTKTLDFIIDKESVFFEPELKIEQRKSISAQPTYILSPKSTQISIAPTHHNVLYRETPIGEPFYRRSLSH